MNDSKKANVRDVIFIDWDGVQTSTVRVRVRIDGDTLVEHAPGTDRDGQEVAYRYHDGKWKNSISGVEGRLT
jgi:hypothetical protein